VSLIELNQRASFIQAKLAAQKELLNDLKTRRSAAEEDRKTKAGTLLFLQHLSKKLNEKNETQAARLATLALAEVFPDLNITLEIEHTEARGTPATTLKLKDHEKGAIGDPCDSFGGGPACLLGVILRVVTTVRQKGLSRILILDEPMIQISGQYQERAAKLLRKLCEPTSNNGLGFDMLVITHNPIFMTAAHKVYNASTTENGKSLKIRDGNNPEESDI
jgi:DNA repair ATPase RecN